MAHFDTSATALTREVFTMAERVAKTEAEVETLETELNLEIIYQVRMARRRTHDCSRYASAELQHIAGWN